MNFFKRIFKPSQPPAPGLLMDNDWRSINWDAQETMKKDLKKIEVRNPDVEYLRILVHGPVGSGKSSFINSIDSVFQEYMTSGAIAEAATARSFTKMFKVHGIRDGKTREHLPFVLCDIMGLERGDSEGMHPSDLIGVLKGQIEDRYKCNPRSACSEDNRGFISQPTLKDRIHCLVSVIPADKVNLMVDDDFKKMRQIREQASDMGIPQVTILTKVDWACPEVQKDIRMVYRSKKIKELMQECSNSLGVTMNLIFPVKNYHEEIDLKPDVNVLLLSALTHILRLANGYVEDQSPAPPANIRRSNNK